MAGTVCKIEIEAVANGYVAKFSDGEGVEVSVYQEKDGDEQEQDQEHMVAMLYDIIEFFGAGGSKHDKKRIRVSYEDQ